MDNLKLIQFKKSLNSLYVKAPVSGIVPFRDEKIISDLQVKDRIVL
ncbi:hypothetical protein [Clostridium tagluense]|nr:hypothetical protein [Clostridium tagluense]MBW9157271.1 hypothetical protein [Clostridium tagluense]WLC67574.1 hypothetical protein KTC93_10570 [Clostridium tagluense]